MTPRIDLRPDHLEIVCAILREHVPERGVLAFGSRASWTAKEYSDLDLAVLGDDPLPIDVASALTEEFSESDLPFKVDIVEWALIDETFRDIICRNRIVVHSPKVILEEAEPSICAKKRLDWSLATIEEISEKVAMGPFGSSIKVETFVPSGVPIISGSHLHGSRVDDTPRYNYITESHAQQLSNANVQRGDIVFTHRGNIGQVAYIPEDSRFPRYVISQSQFFMRCDTSKAVPEFVTAYFKSPEGQHKLLANASQVGVPSIAQPVTYLRTIEIPLPSLTEQRAIAHILCTLDEKIELNQCMNETLEEMAQALFKSWFVDFEPVRAKMEGRDTGLPKQFEDLFPSRLADSELGEIPEGWVPRKLGECFTLLMGQSPPSSTYNAHGKGLPFFQGRKDFGFRFPKNRKFCTAPTRMACPGDTLISVRAPVGDINMALTKSCIGRGVAALRHNSGSSSFTFYATHSMQKRLRMYEHTGTVFGAINKNQFENLPILNPERNLVEIFDTTVGPVDSRIRRNTLEIELLTDLRDSLLPKLISGQMRMKDLKMAV